MSSSSSSGGGRKQLAARHLLEDRWKPYLHTRAADPGTGTWEGGGRGDKGVIEGGKGDGITMTRSAACMENVTCVVKDVCVVGGAHVGSLFWAWVVLTAEWLVPGTPALPL